MAIDNIARGLAASLVGEDGKVASDKLPTMPDLEDKSSFTSIGKLTDVSQVAGKTADEILMMMLFGVINPTFTMPSLSVTLGPYDVLTVGRAQQVSGSLTFDRGSITPAYSTSGYRAGLPTSYRIGDDEEASRATTYDFNLIINPTIGDNIIVCSVDYEAGEQPVNSINQPYSNPLAAGTVSATIVLKGVYQPYIANGDAINFIYFDENDGEGYQVVSATESFGTKQSFAIAKDVTVVGVKQVDPMTQKWVWLNGSAEESLKLFDTTIITGDSLGESVDYIQYTHNGSATGERQLRFYISYN